MNQCSVCREYFDSETDVEIWWDEQPFHRDCLKEKAEEEMIDPGRVNEIIDDTDVFAIEKEGPGVIRVLRDGGGSE